MKKYSEMAKTTDLGRRFLAAQNISDFLSIWLTNRLLPPAEQQVFDTYYASFRRNYSRRLCGFYDSQTEEVMALIAANQGLRLLEIGSGCGSESLWFALHGAVVTGLDLKADRVSVAKRRLEVLACETGNAIPCTFKQASLFDFEKSDPFDVIWLEQAFHHLEPRDAVIDRIVELLGPGGHLVVSEANALNPLLQIQLLLRRGLRTVSSYEDEEGRVHPYGNERIITAAGLRGAFARRGIGCLSIRHFRVFPNRAAFDGLAWLEKGLSRNCLAPMTTHFNYVGRRN